MTTKETHQSSGIKQYHINELTPKTYGNPPIELVRFRDKHASEKQEAGEKFYAQEFITVYLDEKWKAESENRSNILWLLEIYECVSDPDKKVLADKVFKFYDVIKDYDHPYRALMLDKRIIDKIQGLRRRTQQEVNWDD